MIDMNTMKSVTKLKPELEKGMSEDQHTKLDRSVDVLASFEGNGNEKYAHKATS